MSLEEKQIGHYHLLHVIGRGGMGEVYLGEDQLVHREVAVKLIKLQARQESEEKSLRLFLHEVKTIAQFDHPGILPLYDYGEETIDGMPCAYLITPYRVEGSLDTWLHKRAQHQQTRNLTGKQVTHLIGQAAGALQYAHDQRVIHLDVKPANFLIRSQSADDAYPDLQLADFGIARFLTGTSTVSRQVRGTSSYMAPEQWAGEPDVCSDQYALAIMAYELLTGSPPFQGTPMRVMYAHFYGSPRSPRSLNPLLPTNVDEVVLRALAKKPEERFPSVLAFAQALQIAFKEGDEQITVRVLPSSPVPLVLQLSSPASSASTTVEEASAPFLTSTQHAAPPPVNDGATPIPAYRPPSLTFSQSTRTEHRSLVWRTALSVSVLLLLSGIFAALEVPGFLKVGGGSPAHPHATVHTQAIGTAFAQSTGTAMAREPGSIWVAHTLQGAEAYDTLNGIAWSGQQKQYVAVGDDSQGQEVILTSPDGITWASHLLSTTTLLENITWSASRSQYIAVGDGEAIQTWPSGEVWTPHVVPETLLQYRTLTSAACSASQCVVVGDLGTILTSPNERDWTLIDSGDGLNSVVWSEEQRQFVAVGDYGRIQTSPDGQIWTLQGADADPSDSFEDIIWSGSEYVVVGIAGTILTSPDGKHWTQQVSDMHDVSDSFGGSESFIFHAVTAAGSHYIAVATVDDGLKSTWAILTSSDGKNWTIQFSGTPTNDLSVISNPFLDIVWSGSRLVAVGGDAGTILTSPGA